MTVEQGRKHSKKQEMISNEKKQPRNQQEQKIKINKNKNNGALLTLYPEE